MFLKKHLDYLQEALACLLSANYNALACLLRIMIENYVCFSLIKKYKKYDLWKDWYIHGCYKALRIAAGEPYHSKTEKVYKSICDDLNLPYDYIKDKGSYGWVRRAIKLKRYTFKSVCALIDENIYKDFEWLSSYIQNNDILAKQQVVLMELLANFVYQIYFYTDKMIAAYDSRYFKRVYYRQLRNDLLLSIDKCINFKENIDIY